MTINNTVLIGRLVRDAELRTTKSGKSVANFTLAVDNLSEELDPADFIDCVAWGSTADVLHKYAPKGKQIAISGRLSTRTYEDKGGNSRKATEVVVSNLQLLGGKDKAPQEDVAPTDIDDNISLEDIPF